MHECIYNTKMETKNFACGKRIIDEKAYVIHTDTHTYKDLITKEINFMITNKVSLYKYSRKCLVYI